MDKSRLSFYFDSWCIYLFHCSVHACIASCHLLVLFEVILLLKLSLHFVYADTCHFTFWEQMSGIAARTLVLLKTSSNCLDMLCALAASCVLLWAVTAVDKPKLLLVALLHKI